jgi:hypothetical protein
MLDRTFSCDECGTNITVTLQRVAPINDLLQIARHEESCSSYSETRWREMVGVPGLPFDLPGYWISDDGRVIGRRGKELRTFPDKEYSRVLICGLGLRVNRLVCIVYNGPPPSGLHQAAHKDCDPKNNHWWNLEWKTAWENQANPITRRATGHTSWPAIRRAAESGDRETAIRMIDEYVAGLPA